MRQGQNPAKMGLPAYQPKKLGLALLSYIPVQNGYFTQSLDILKYQIASIHRSTQDFDLLVFDNGSCQEVQDELRRLQARGLIHFLVLSSFNLGKTGALNWILAALPNDLIGFADGDVLFRPTWLEKTLEIRQAFPKAGLITAQPCFFDILRGTGQAHLSLANDVRYHLFNQYLNPSDVEEYGRGTGLTAEQILAIKKLPSQMVKEDKSGVCAVIGASHMQFVLSREIARQVIPLPSSFALYRDEDVVLNRNIDAAGYLHLSTLEAYVYHMGNRLDEITMEEILHMGLDEILQHAPATHTVLRQATIKPSKKRAFQVLSRLARIPIFKKTLQRLYNFLFEFFAREK